MSPYAALGPPQLPDITISAPGSTTDLTVDLIYDNEQGARAEACKHCKAMKEGRNLILSFDGTSNQFGKTNTNVVELYRRIVKDEKQLTYYNSGIGTYAKSSIASWRYWKQVLNNKIDLAIAWNFEKILLAGYRWLSDTYQPGDRIFLFGFSRGAYQVRALAGMIKEVGLILPGNTEQIPFAYELYANLGEDRQYFKETFSRKDVKVHFLGAWDTVSSVGIIRGKSLPMTDEFNDHICYFRHALALDERRVKFQPEYICGGESYKPPPLADDPDRDHVSVKEVWFAGCHSDIGGGNKDNTTLNNATVPVLWMGNEALIAGLRLDKSRVVWKWGELEDQNKDARDSLTPAWLPFEILPFKRLSYTDRARHTWRPHLAGVRVIKPHQKVHASVAFIKDYTPKATLALSKSKTEIKWARICNQGVKDNVEWSDGLEHFLEMDLFDYANAPVIVKLAKDDPDNPFFIRRLKFMASFFQGAQAIYDADPKFELFCKMVKSDGEAKTVGALLLCKVVSWVKTKSEVMLDDLPEDKDQWIAMRDNKLVFNILEPEIVKHGLKHTFHELDPSSASDGIIDVLMQAASYFHLFNLDKSAARNSVLKDKINIEFKRLKNSTLDEPNLFCDGVINVNVSEEDAEYALKVTNNTSEDFFLAVWTFEPINFDFNDKTAYKPSPTGHSELDQTLKGHGGSVTVGHGSPRVTPFSYDFAYGQKVDVVFLKLFFFPFLELDNVPKVHPLQFLLDPTHPPSGTIVIPVLVRQAS